MCYVKRNPLVSEANQLLQLGGPIVLTYLLGYGLQLISVAVVGALAGGPKFLAAAGLGALVYNLFGIAPMSGFVTALDTLASQALGRGNRLAAGRLCSLSLVLVGFLCAISTLILFFSGAFLSLTGQDPEVVALAAIFCHYSVPALWLSALFEVLKKWLSAQGLGAPPSVAVLLTLPIHWATAWGLVHHSPLGFIGSPIANGVSAACMSAFLIFYNYQRRQFVSQVAAAAAAKPTTAPRMELELAQWAPLTEPFPSLSEPSPKDDSSERAMSPKPSPRMSPRGGGGHRRTSSLPELSLVPVSPRLVAMSTPLELVSEDTMSNDSIGSMLPIVSCCFQSRYNQLVQQAQFFVSTGKDISLAHPVLLSTHDSGGSWPRFGEAIKIIGLLLALGCPAALEICMEWGLFEAQSLLAGQFGSTQLAAHTVLVTTSALAFMAPLGLSVAASIRIGSFLGSQQPKDARRTALVASLVGVVGLVLQGVAFCAIRGPWAQVWSVEPEVQREVELLVPLITLFSLFDCSQAILSGSLRGVGRQGVVALVNTLSYGGVAPGCAILLGFGIAGTPALGLSGIWLGSLVGAATACLLLSLTLYFTNWQYYSDLAVKRATAHEELPAAAAAAASA
jgi:Na+-driven multidrug efflux pump